MTTDRWEMTAEDCYAKYEHWLACYEETGWAWAEDLAVEWFFYAVDKGYYEEVRS